MKKLILITVILVVLQGCDQFKNPDTPPKPSKFSANVQNIQGLYIFIISEPQLSYKTIGLVQNDVLSQVSESIDNSGSKTKAAKILSGGLNT
ncbi:MAG TPA: hypothetical protein VIK89_11460, partial [Cytophagaceae bacterium]